MAFQVPIPFSITSLSTDGSNIASAITTFETKSRQVIAQSNRLTKEDAGTLLTKIRNHEVADLIFSEDLTTVLSLDYDLSLYRTDIHPQISGEVVKEAKEHQIRMIFQPVDYTLSRIFQALISAPIIYVGFSVLRGIFTMNRMMPMGGNRGSNGVPNGGLTTTRLDQQKQQQVTTLKDWAGSPEVFEECTEIVSYLKNSTQYKKAGARIPRGILLEGPPGTGKTMLARAIANEARANFVAVTGSEFVELFVGMGASRVRKLFNEARKKKPCILFIDEIDALGKQRNSASGFGGNDEREQTLNQLLAEMDGFYESDDVLVIGATNRRDILDAALLRPGRFDRIVAVPLPDASSRRAILEVHRKNLQLEEGVSWDTVVSLTTGFSGAQLKNLLNEAAILCAREGGEIITQSHLMSALEKLVVGIVRKIETRDADTLERVAIHEIGHTMAVLAFPHIVDLDKVSIQSTYSGAGGYTLFREKEALTEGGMYTKSILFSKLMIMLGGKAAECVYYGRDQVSLGAYQDLKQANDLARKMIVDYGMGNALEVYARSSTGSSVVSEYLATRTDREALALVDAAYNNVTALLCNDYSKMLVLKDRLLEKRVLLGSDCDC
jgi:cell division protease FtsH